MANDSRPVVGKASETGGLDGGAPKRPSLSIAEAELFASRIQPSWELVDDALRDEVAAELGLSGSASKPAGDTIIEGVPSVAVGSGPLAVPPEAPVAERIAGIPVVAIAAAEAPARAEPAAAPKPEPAVEARKAPPAAPPAKPGKTKTGVGDGPKSGGVAKTLPDTAAAKAPAGKTPAPASRPAAAPAGKSAPGAVAAASASRPDVTDDIEIPISGASGGLIAKIGLGLVAVIALGAIGYGVLGGSSPPKKDTTPTATATATVAAVPLPATVPPPPPEPKATAAAPSATATSAATTSAATPTATAVARAPDPKPEVKKAAPPPDRPVVPKATGTPAVKKTGGGIIRETPF